MTEFSLRDCPNPLPSYTYFFIFFFFWQICKTGLMAVGFIFIMFHLLHICRLTYYKENEVLHSSIFFYHITYSPYANLCPWRFQVRSARLVTKPIASSSFIGLFHKAWVESGVGSFCNPLKMPQKTPKAVTFPSYPFQRVDDRTHIPSTVSAVRLASK